jgi:hypothetical protein
LATEGVCGRVWRVVWRVSEGGLEGVWSHSRQKRLQTSGSPATPLRHRSDPAQLLALAALLYGCRPDTWLLTIPLADLGMGVGFSPSARNGIPTALLLVRKQLQEWETV